MVNYSVSADGVPVAGDSVFIRQLIAWLLAIDLIYLVAIAAAVLLICWVVRFIITLKEDR